VWIGLIWYNNYSARMLFRFFRPVLTRASLSVYSNCPLLTVRPNKWTQSSTEAFRYNLDSTGKRKGPVTVSVEHGYKSSAHIKSVETIDVSVSFSKTGTIQRG
jgi:hypothetical protein